MKAKKNNEAMELSRHISNFLTQYAPYHLTNSPNTLRSYEAALALYVGFLENKCGITPTNFTKECFDQKHIEDWLVWLIVELSRNVQS